MYSNPAIRPPISSLELKSREGIGNTVNAAEIYNELQFTNDALYQ